MPARDASTPRALSGPRFLLPALAGMAARRGFDSKAITSAIRQLPVPDPAWRQRRLMLTITPTLLISGGHASHIPATAADRRHSGRPPLPAHHHPGRPPGAQPQPGTVPHHGPAVPGAAGTPGQYSPYSEPKAALTRAPGRPEPGHLRLAARTLIRQPTAQNRYGLYLGWCAVGASYLGPHQAGSPARACPVQGSADAFPRGRGPGQTTHTGPRRAGQAAGPTVRSGPRSGPAGSGRRGSGSRSCPGSGPGAS